MSRHTEIELNIDLLIKFLSMDEYLTDTSKAPAPPFPRFFFGLTTSNDVFDLLKFLCSPVIKKLA